MNEVRKACAVYQENIVVSGGMVTDGRVLNTVEPYDVFFNEFSPMPNMIKGKYSCERV